MTARTLDDINKIAKDALYVTVGLGVIAFQKAQVQRQELSKRWGSQVGDVSKQLDDRVRLVEERLQAIETQVDAALDQLEARLPDQAKAVSQQARSAAKQVRSLVNRAS